jgi:hypothetical protein
MPVIRLRGQGLSARETARVMAAMNVAIFDAFVACWHAKLRHWTPRSVTVIRDALDAAFTPHIATPGFPAYLSGHAMISGAASEVLAAYAPAQRAPTEAAAAEAALSRLYGGIHFRATTTKAWPRAGGSDSAWPCGRLGRDALSAPRDGAGVVLTRAGA